MSSHQKVQFNNWEDAAKFIAALLESGSTATFEVYQSERVGIVLEFTGGF